jgi:hypothetical protein
MGSSIKSSKTILDFMFINGLNVIRCSDDYLLVSRSTTSSTSLLNYINKCNNGSEILSQTYTSFEWKGFDRSCDSSTNEVHEHQYINVVKNDGLGDQLPHIRVKINEELDDVPDIISLIRRYDDDNQDELMLSLTRITDPQQYYVQVKNVNERQIYISFLGYSMICRIRLTGSTDKICITDDNIKAEQACYYTPDSNDTPEREHMEIEFQRVEQVFERQKTIAIYQKKILVYDENDNVLRLSR